ncbi:hypothetical protein Thiowin_03975 [Thiorhodovibrio winogradskyi]|uniref:DUF4224 domain-containing protein n=1 Tax=Thiorhodovibrio winogradskyi TaxID=77007 RepID=A0ABZ0SEZ0_9GAMM|nr:DUF4224 domain-containing protein [Thiorhodovibrio winogradskyi]
MSEEPFFLTDEDIADLTGYVRTDKQREHLRELGIPFFPDRDGRPRVPRNVFRLFAIPQRFRVIEGDIEYRAPYPLPPRPKNLEKGS